MTNWTLSFSGCLDYVFHTPRLRVVAVLEPQDAADPVLLAYKAAPNPILPSDHSQLMAEFELDAPAPAPAQHAPPATAPSAPVSA